MKYTGWRQNDVNVQGCTGPPRSARPAARVERAEAGLAPPAGRCGLLTRRLGLVGLGADVAGWSMMEQYHHCCTSQYKLCTQCNNCTPNRL
jgi:hypothetical protein